jgi:NDP-sugar pyrophosphorylase family protein
MKAMVLAAGLGERMRPLTEGRAKPSLPLVNRPIIIQTLAYLKSHGVDEAVINLHYQPESIRGLVGDGSRIGLRVHFSEEQSILGTAGGLKKAEAHFRDAGTFVLINSDFATDCDLTAAVQAHQKSAAVSTLILAPRRGGTEYSPVVMSGDGRIISIAGSGREDEGEAFTFTGIHILEPSILEAIPVGVRYEINREVYPVLMHNGALIRGYVHSGFWHEMGTPRLYLEGALDVLAQGRDSSIEPLRTGEGIYLDGVGLPANTVSGPPLFVGRGSTIGSHCSLQGGVIIGRHCRLGAGCALRSTLVWDGARLGDKVQLSDCIVTSGVYVPPMTNLTGRILFRVDGYQGRKDHLERVGASWAARLT